MSIAQSWYKWKKLCLSRVPSARRLILCVNHCFDVFKFFQHQNDFIKDQNVICHCFSFCIKTIGLKIVIFTYISLSACAHFTHSRRSFKHLELFQGFLVAKKYHKCNCCVTIQENRKKVVTIKLAKSLLLCEQIYSHRNTCSNIIITLRSRLHTKFVLRSNLLSNTNNRNVKYQSTVASQ